MNNLQAYSLTLCILTIFHFALAFNVVKMRWKYKRPHEHQGEKDLIKAIRSQQNFAEYVPLTLIVLGMLSFFEVNFIYYYTLNAVLVLARFSHAFGLLCVEPKKPYRIQFRAIGFLTTHLITVLGALTMAYYLFLR